MFGLRPRRHPIQRLDFIVAGAQKAGTTALNYYLRRHPRIALPRKKELHFFDDDELFTLDPPPYEYLHRMFAPAPAGCLAGENTPSYLYWPAAMARIRDYNPQMKLVLILRNPVERAFSQWNMQRHRGIEPLDFLDALRAEPARRAAVPGGQLRRLSYLERGRYAEQLGRAFALFPRDQFRILKYEEFRAHQPELVARIFRFLGLEPPRFRPVQAHGIPYARPLRPEERAAACEMMASDIRRLEELLGWDCSDWRPTNDR